MKSVLLNALAIGLAIIVIAGVVIYQRRPEAELKPEQNVVVVPARTTLTEKDSDGDGLHDWEEILWASNPNNPDSDGDGTLDGDEVAEGRDPNMSGPDDTFNATTSPIITPNTITEHAAYDIASAVVAGEDTDTIVSDAVEKVVALRSEYIPLTATDLVIGNSDTNSLYTYAQQLDQIFDSIDTSAISGDEQLTPSDTSGLTTFALAANIFDEMHTKLLRVLVPSEAVSLHLEYLNAVGNTALNLRTLESLTVDPLAALTTLAQLEKDTQTVDIARKNLLQFLNSASGYEFSVDVY